MNDVTLLLAASGSDSGGLLVSVLVALITGGAGATALGAWRYRKQGTQERDTLISQATADAVNAARAMLDEYRRELDAAKLAIKELNDKLGQSNERIARLETDLQYARKDRDQLQAELQLALERRAALQDDVKGMQRRIEDLEGLMRMRTVGERGAGAPVTEDARTEDAP